jgi:hypothetical protein
VPTLKIRTAKWHRQGRGEGPSRQEENQAPKRRRKVERHLSCSIPRRSVRSDTGTLLVISINQVTVANDEGTAQNRVEVDRFVRQIEQDRGRRQISAQFEDDDPQMIDTFVTMPTAEMYRVWRGYPPQQQQQYQHQQQQEQQHQHQQQRLFPQHASSGLLPQAFALQPGPPMQPTQSSYGDFNTNGNVMPDQNQYGHYAPNNVHGGGWQQ